jgi:hypothetical protein
LTQSIAKQIIGFRFPFWKTMCPGIYEITDMADDASCSSGFNSKLRYSRDIQELYGQRAEELVLSAIW